jgi:ABC-2 type transport system permease protein
MRGRLLAVLIKEFRQIRRDFVSLSLLVFVPAMLLVLYGYALTFDVKHVRVAALDLSRTTESRLLLDSLFQNEYFDRVGEIARLEDVDQALVRGRAQAVLVVPVDYAASLARGEEVRVPVFVDGANSNTATTVIGYLDALAARTNQRLAATAIERGGAAARLPGVVPEPRIWFNPDLKSVHFLVPGLIGMLLMLAAVIVTSLSIVREKERETIEQMTVSPLRPMELILGKTIPYLLICLVTMVLILVLGGVMFGVVVRGSYLLLTLTTFVFLLAALGMGVLISSVTRSQQVAYQLATLSSMLPSILLSGFIFPIKNMPPPVRAITYIVAPRYFVDALRKIILKGAPASALVPDLVPLVILAVFFNILAARNTRKAL